MSLIRKSDVRNDLSTTIRSLYAFGLQRSDGKATAGGEEPDAPAEGYGISSRPGMNAQVRVSVRVLRNAKTGKRSW